MIEIRQGECRRLMAEMPECSVDAVVTDPPYELNFMGSQTGWDKTGVAFDFMTWVGVLRILKPGGHLLAFGGTRTFHRIACAIEDAGFEIRDCCMWLYGCLSDDTEILVDGKWEPYHMATEGRRALCYDADRDEFSWQPIARLFVYDYDDTAYRVVSDCTDQIVTRGHRCLVERGGAYVFEYAEEAARQRETRVPVLEGLHGLLEVLPVHDEGPGDAPQDVLRVMPQSDLRKVRAAEEGAERDLRGVRQRILPSAVSSGSGRAAEMLAELQWPIARSGPDQARAQGASCMDRRVAGEFSKEDVGGEQPRLERRGDVLPEARQLQACQVRPLSSRAAVHGPQGRVRHGASATRGAGDWTPSDARGDSPPREPRPAGQPAGEPRAVQVQPRPQAVRASRFTRADLVRFEPFDYRGIVWCVQVPTGAFVARRNGKVFVTGNSGFPKSHDVAKAIDKKAGKWRGRAGAVMSKSTALAGPHYEWTDKGDPITAAAATWEGWGTALKPSWEPVIVARKPLEGSVVECVLKHGTGAINVDGCRVGGIERFNPAAGNDGLSPASVAPVNVSGYGGKTVVGRWPSNVILDEEAGAILDAQSGDRPGMKSGGRHRADYSGGMFGGIDSETTARGDHGGASRFYFCPKASKHEREFGLDLVDDRGERERAGVGALRDGRRGSERANVHATVKPIALMRWLVRLVTPPGGLVVDPFVGSGTTAIAAMLEGFDCVGLELGERHADIARKRVAAFQRSL